MIPIDDRDRDRPSTPPISTAERRAERTAAAVDLAVRLGRIERPASVATARPSPPARLSAPREPVPTEVLDGFQGSPATPRDFASLTMPSDVIAALLPPPAVPADFVGASHCIAEVPIARPPRIAVIIGAVAGYYRISRTDLLSARRAKAVVRPRQLAMWLAATLTRASLPEIGRRFGNRDHTTVLHARRATDARIVVDPELKADAEALIDLLTRATR